MALIADIVKATTTKQNKEKYVPFWRNPCMPWVKPIFDVDECTIRRTYEDWI